MLPYPNRKEFYMISRNTDNYFLAGFEIKEFSIDIETHYNDDFKSINEDIFNALETERNGLVLLHGKYGTGKTHYIRHLISKIDRKFIYVPVNMMDFLSSPEFLPFISRHKNSVLILEDCEKLLVHRDNGFNNSSGISNLLNLGDGLLSDALSINVICTFNSSTEKIDDALLRKGRILAKYEFGNLKSTKAQMLADKIGKQIEITRPMTVAEIYNCNDKDFANKARRAIGFSVH